MSATLQTIRNKMRSLTARDESQLSDAACDYHINNYLQYGMPADLRILKMEDTYTFSTQPGIDVYAFDSENYDYVQDPVRIGGYPCKLFTEPAQFYAVRPRYSYVQQIATGNNTMGPYTGQISSTPFHRSYNTTNNNPSDTTLSTFPYTTPIGIENEVLISAQMGNSYSLNATDTPTLISGSGTGLNARFQDTGTFIGDVQVQQSGSINYFTGAVEITFSQPVPQGNQIFASVYVYAASRPRYVLFFQNQILVSPVPDNGYIVEMKTYRKPASLMYNTSLPELQELWQVIAFGAAMSVFEDNLDVDSIAKLQGRYDYYESIARARGLIQITRVRNPTVYSQPWQTPITDGTPYFAGS
jgi:hypothetical protein